MLSENQYLKVCLENEDKIEDGMSIEAKSIKAVAKESWEIVRRLMDENEVKNENGEPSTIYKEDRQVLLQELLSNMTKSMSKATKLQDRRTPPGKRETKEREEDKSPYQKSTKRGREMNEYDTIEIKNFHFNDDEKKIVEYFRRFGHIINQNFPTKTYKGKIQLKGIGYIQYEYEGDAKEAAEQTDEIGWMGRRLYVKAVPADGWSSGHKVKRERSR